MALSAKDRERIIEEETLRYETRMNLHKAACASRPLRWPWIILGAVLVYALYCWVFCGAGSCSMGGHYGMKGHSCHGYMLPESDDAGQPIKPEKK